VAEELSNLSPLRPDGVAAPTPKRENRPGQGRVPRSRNDSPPGRRRPNKPSPAAEDDQTPRREDHPGQEHPDGLPGRGRVVDYQA